MSTVKVEVGQAKKRSLMIAVIKVAGGKRSWNCHWLSSLKVVIVFKPQILNQWSCCNSLTNLTELRFLCRVFWVCNFKKLCDKFCLPYKYMICHRFRLLLWRSYLLRTINSTYLMLSWLQLVRGCPFETVFVAAVFDKLFQGSPAAQLNWWSNGLLLEGTMYSFSSSLGLTAGFDWPCIELFRNLNQ